MENAGLPESPSAGARIYISDSGNSRIVRIDDMSGAGWTTYGSLGSSVGQFDMPMCAQLDADSRLYIADFNNNRIVRINGMSGGGWVEFGAGYLSTPYGVFIR